VTAATAQLGEAAGWGRATTLLVTAAVLVPAAVLLVALSEGTGGGRGRRLGESPWRSQVEPRDLQTQFSDADSGIVVDLASRVASALALDARSLEAVTLTAALRDVGNARVPREILDKPGHLNMQEFKRVQAHTIAGEAILNEAGGDFRRISRLVRSCHERCDGGGYPDGLRADAIPLVSRIVFCCDAFGAMTRDRPYRRAMPVVVALEELKRASGTQFDPRVVETVCELIESEALDRSQARELDAPLVRPASLQPV
jgi:HD-GYP domain-containing protein (c-di-GMP phosphodiesterase class II)